MAAVVSALGSALCGAGIAPGRACIPWGGDVKKDILPRHAVGRFRGERRRFGRLQRAAAAVREDAARYGAAQLQSGAASGDVEVAVRSERGRRSDSYAMRLAQRICPADAATVDSCRLCFCSTL
jgi:hypothetical protein